MAEATKLTYERTVLVKVLQDALDKRVADRKEKQKIISERNSEARERIYELTNKHPEFLVWLNTIIEETWGESAIDEDLEKVLAKTYRALDGTRESTFDEDDSLKRLLRVYENAADDIVVLEEQDAVLKYL